jgi:hypothetical protein
VADDWSRASSTDTGLELEPCCASQSRRREEESASSPPPNRSLRRCGRLPCSLPGLLSLFLVSRSSGLKLSSRNMSFSARRYGGFSPNDRVARGEVADRLCGQACGASSGAAGIESRPISRATMQGALLPSGCGATATVVVSAAACAQRRRRRKPSAKPEDAAMRERWRIGGGLFELKVEGKASRGKDARRGRKKRTGQGGKRLGAVLIYIVSYYNNNGCSVLFITTVIFLKKYALQLSL